MAFRKPIDKKTNKSVRVKNSYYTFSKDYPVGNIGRPKKDARKRKNKRTYLRISAAVICFVLLFCASYFVSELGIRFSYKQPPETSQTEADEALALSPLLQESIKALYMPMEKLSDTQYIKQLIREIGQKDFNSVVIDFKDENGRLAYSSKNEKAVLAKCSVFDNQTVQNALSIFENANVNVIARVFCFKDPLISSKYSDMAVKYMNSQVLWLDRLEQDGGKPWLNPYSDDARDYIQSIIEEISALNVKAFILDGLSFPDSDNLDTAGFPGESDKSKRNSILLSFAESIKNSLPADFLVLLATDANDALSGNEVLYSGTIAKNNTDGLCVNTFARPKTFVIDKKTDYSSAISLCSQIKQNMNAQAKLVLWIDYSEYSAKYLKALAAVGYDSFILYSDNAEY